MSVRVALVVWEAIGENEKKIRILGKEVFNVSELDLIHLPLVGMELGEKITSGMILETIGHKRSESQGKENE